jgi:hypothetical protein
MPEQTNEIGQQYEAPIHALQGKIVKNKLIYYTVVYTMDENHAQWYASAILESSAVEAMKRFQSYSGVSTFVLVQIDLEAKPRKGDERNDRTNKG